MNSNKWVHYMSKNKTIPMAQKAVKNGKKSKKVIKKRPIKHIKQPPEQKGKIGEKLVQGFRNLISEMSFNQVSGYYSKIKSFNDVYNEPFETPVTIGDEQINVDFTFQIEHPGKRTITVYGESKNRIDMDLEEEFLRFVLDSMKIYAIKWDPRDDNLRFLFLSNNPFPLNGFDWNMKGQNCKFNNYLFDESLDSKRKKKVKKRLKDIREFYNQQNDDIQCELKTFYSKIHIIVIQLDFLKTVLGDSYYV